MLPLPPTDRKDEGVGLPRLAFWLVNIDDDICNPALPRIVVDLATARPTSSIPLSKLAMLPELSLLFQLCECDVSSPLLLPYLGCRAVCDVRTSSILKLSVELKKDLNPS